MMTQFPGRFDFPGHDWINEPDSWTIVVNVIVSGLTGISRYQRAAARSDTMIQFLSVY